MYRYALAIAVAAIAACSKPSPDAPPPTAPPAADVILHGGPILTMEGDEPTYVEAIAIDEGRIAFAGSLEDAMQLQGNATEVRDLDGRTLMPGFIDGHAHVIQFGSQAIGANLLAPPDGEVNTIDDIVARLKEFADGPDVSRTGWVFGTGYDDSLLGRHPTRHDLDRVSTELPVIVVHISGHFSVMNSAGLATFGIDADTENPEGGIIRREDDGRTPNGVLEELASIPYVMKILNPPAREDKDYFLQRGLELAKSYGYTTAAEGRMLGTANADLMNAAERGLLDIDVIGWQDYTGMDQLEQHYGESYENHYRLGGLKVTLDGSPQGRTAWRTRPYLLPPDGQGEDYAGYPAIPDTEQVRDYLETAYANDWPVKVHANGDAAIDQMLTALRPIVGGYPERSSETILVHGQFLRQDQIPVLKELDVFPSMFPMHTFYWGDWYDTIVGPDLAVQISPMRSLLDSGLHVTSHTDAPVALPNLLQVAWATVNRVSRSGKVMGEGERVSAYEAMKMVTLWGAEEFGEADEKGSITVGKVADLVVLSDDPVAVDPMTINRIQVLETIKDGMTVWTAN